jgi:hypothetical protein
LDSFSELLAELCSPPGALAPDRRLIKQDSSRSEPWLFVRGEAPMPEQGWKLHVSSGVPSAEHALRRAVPVLLEEGIDFKVAGSLQFLAAMNDGLYGYSQIGKFITAYPPDAGSAVRLARRLDEATRGLRGPAIPSDRPLAPGSAVYYRYGGFREQTLRTALGSSVPAIVSPQGELVPDMRRAVYAPPAWASDPFLAAGVAQPLPEPERVIARRYLLLSRLYRSARGAVHLGLDLDTLRSCIIKRAPRNAQLLADGSDARDRLRREHSLLERLSPHPSFPTPYALEEEADELFLVMELVDGDALDELVRAQAEQGRLPSVTQVVAWGRALAQALSAVHRTGLVHRDIKGANVLVPPEGGLKLIDFDIAFVPGQPLFGVGTRGYLSPQQHASAPPAPADDVHAVGAVLYLALTGAEPSLAPHPFSLLERPVLLLRPEVPPALEAVVAQCLDPEPSRRPPSMEALEDALRAVEVLDPIAPVPPGAESHPEEDSLRARYLGLARRVAQALGRHAKPGPQGQLGWASTYRGSPMHSRDLYHGTAGVALALAESLDVEPSVRLVVEEALRGLHALRGEEGSAAAASLYMGEAGVAVALLRAGQLLKEPKFITSALERADFVASQPHTSPDMIVGTAGRLRSHLLLWDETREPRQLQAAVAAGEWLLSASEPVGPEACRWVIPPGFDDLSGHAYPGYAHGAAGVGDVLLELHEATGDERFRVKARGALAWVTSLAVPALEDGSGRAWPMREGGSLFALWCYGAPGIGTFLLHAAGSELSLEARALAESAAHATSRVGRWAAPTQCHGLAGSLELLLDMYQGTGDRAWLTEAWSLARLLETFLVESEEGPGFSSDVPELVTPDYMVGTAGVLACLLRLADPQHRPRQLSRRGFRFRPTPHAER